MTLSREIPKTGMAEIRNRDPTCTRINSADYRVRKLPYCIGEPRSARAAHAGSKILKLEIKSHHHIVSYVAGDKFAQSVIKGPRRKTPTTAKVAQYAPQNT